MLFAVMNPDYTFLKIFVLDREVFFSMCDFYRIKIWYLNPGSYFFDTPCMLKDLCP